MTFKSILIAASALSLAACATYEATDTASTMTVSAAESAKLTTVLAAQDEKAKARYDARHPQQTLEFFGITPGMTVAEALPGGGWYSKVLIPYLGDEGHLVGVDYSLAMWPEFGGFANAEFLEKKKTWPATWVEGAQEWRAGSEGQISAFPFGGRDAAMDGKVDAVLFIRALHNLSRFDEKGGYLTEALADTHALLKPGGIVGVVQHQGPEGNDDKWADGNNGYLKKSQLIAKFEGAGFELVKESDINMNPKDVPNNEDIVWRLPPTLATSRDNPEMKAKMEAIGESNRMTLLFKKV